MKTTQLQAALDAFAGHQERVGRIEAASLVRALSQVFLGPAAPLKTFLSKLPMSAVPGVASEPRIAVCLEEADIVFDLVCVGADSKSAREVHAVRDALRNIGGMSVAALVSARRPGTRRNMTGTESSDTEAVVDVLVARLRGVLGTSDFDALLDEMRADVRGVPKAVALEIASRLVSRSSTRASRAEAFDRLRIYNSDMRRLESLSRSRVPAA